MNNVKFINRINQLFHNSGVKQENRFDLLIELLIKYNKNEPIANEFKEFVELLKCLNYNDKDLIQEIFMLLGSKLTKFKLDQFYTPLTISKFISNFMITGDDYKAIDPAGGTGDLLLYYTGKKTIWDIDDNALKLCELNYQLNKQSNYNLLCKNSLENFSEYENTYSYVTMNPPFGSNTTIDNVDILKNFELGKDKKKQEIGILFLELGLKLLKNDGILFIILPSGYLGNSTKQFVELRNLMLKHRIIASIELPSNTFKRSGTGVNTYLVVIQKQDNNPKSKYPIFISSVSNIGYNLSKKDTPKIYKLVETTGEFVHDDLSQPIIDDDFVSITEMLYSFIHKNNILGTKMAEPNTNAVFEEVMTDALMSNILDIKRYKAEYLNLIQEMITLKANKLDYYCKIIKDCTKIDNTKKYKYIDISEIQSPFYGFKELYGWNLPSRAKYTLKKYDILVSKLEGTVSYCVVLTDDDNLICTNGVSVLRPNDMNSLYVLFANITKKDFILQHTAFLTGSIMASLNDSDISSFYMNNNINTNETKQIIDTLEVLQKLRT